MSLRAAVSIGAVLLLGGCGSDGASAAPQTIEDGKLVACTDMPYEPFEFRVDGSERGIDIDLVRAIADRWNLTAEFRDVDFDNIFDELDDRRCDLISSAVSITPERQASYLFSDGYFKINQSLMTRRTDSISSLEDLSGRRVGVQKGTTGADYVMARAPQVQRVDFDDVSDMVGALREQRVDAVVQDFPINSYLAQQGEDFEVVQNFTDVDREEYGFVMRSDASDMRDAVNASLSKIRDDGRYDEILSNYLGRAVD